MATEFLFTGNDILSFRFFWKALLQQEGSHYIIKKICNCRRNRFLQLFFQILTRMKVAFRFSEIAFFKESFILASRMDFRLITNFVLLFGTFFCWWTQCLKLDANQFSAIFSIPISGSSFSG